MLSSLWNGHKYSNDSLRQLVQGLLRQTTGDDGAHGELRLDSEQAAEPKVFVVATDNTHDIPQLFLLRNYVNPNPLSPAGTRQVSAVSAALATSAAPTFFPPVPLSLDGKDRKLVDGGLLANNPAHLAQLEALELFPERGGLRCLVSLGTGPPPKKPSGSPGLMQAAELCLNAATDAEKTHRLMARNFESRPGAYFRLEPQTVGSVELDDTSQKSVKFMQTKTREYLQQEEVRAQIKEIVKLCLPK